MKWLIITLFFTACKGEQDAITEKEEAVLLMHQKVDDIAAQLREDCDSMLIQIARFKADSIKTKALQKKLSNLKK